MGSYHEGAQKFIKDSKKLGYPVKAEDGELIAYPPGTPTSEPSVVRRFGRTILNGVKKGAEAVTAPLVKELKMQDEADKTNQTKGEALNKTYSGRRSTSNGSMIK